MSNPSLPLSSVPDPWERINLWPANKPLKSSEAAIFMRMSESTLSRLRTSGQGPDYFQGGMKMSGKEAPLGTNQHILYFKEDIEAYWRANMVKSKTMAAVKKGQAFATIFDLVEEAAFYVDERGDIDGMVEDAPVDVFLDRLGAWEIVWMPAIEGASHRWTDLAKHQEFAAHASRALSNAQRGIEQSVEATDIGSVAREGSPAQRASIDDRQD